MAYFYPRHSHPTDVHKMSLFFLLVLKTASLLSCCLALSPLVNGGNKKKNVHDHITKYYVSRRRRPIISTVNVAAAAASSAYLYMVPEGISPSNEPQQQSSQQSQTKQRWTEYVKPELETPTATQQEPTYAGIIPPRPKIVVFGASGRIGRRIIKKLLSSGEDIDVVAFVRDAKKLERVLYDDEDLVLGNFVQDRNNDRSGIMKGNGSKNGPQLQVIVADLVSRRDVYGQSFETEREKLILDLWVDRAKNYFTTKGWKYNATTTTSDMKTSSDIEIIESGGEEALRDAVVGSSIVISCLGTFRPSNFWTDYLRVPILRVFRKDVSKWCSDPTHPYYVNFLTTKKILEEAEKEQQRRAASVELENERTMLEEQLRRGRERWLLEKEEEGFDSTIAEGLRKKRNDGLSTTGRQGNTYLNFDREDAVILPTNGRLSSPHDRIKFIRISHVMVGRSPFRVWSCLANIFWSQLSRFELMGEELMESSKLVDTIALRPGELTNDERNSNNTSLQLRIDGKVMTPSLVGRDDVADLAVVAALTSTSLDAAHHFTWALRWTGQHLSPPQGLRPDGFFNAALCFVDAIRGELKSAERRRVNKTRMMSYVGGKELIRLNLQVHRLKPYIQSLAFSAPVYVTLGGLAWYLLGRTPLSIFWKLRSCFGVLAKNIADKSLVF